ncbi:MAG: site-specific DNA-methyltransferase [Planctomycetaceae bacterium]|jgi:DNA modification methylase|nr:site-specific DNA-methyltransferase [Planctomycetaceae bacterium]
MKQQPTASNKIILGDNLEIMRGMDSDSVDLIYLDPPFFSNRNYEVIWGDEGEVRSFKDRWSGGIEHYIAWLKERVIEMHRILKKTGSLYLHCDWHANAYIKVEILDIIFGKNSFRNEIIWKRNFTKKGSQFKMTRLASNADTIYFYTKSNKFTFVTPKSKNRAEADLLKIYDKIDENGRQFKSEPVELPRMMARANLIFEYKGYTPAFGWMMNKDKLDELDRQNKIYFTKNGKPRRKNFLEDYEGSEIDNIWLDILPVGQNQSEIIGYPTQKPEALLERIINVSSNAGDLVLDPFAGGGTTAIVADRLHRRWIAVDQSVQAVKVADLRFQQHPEMFSEYTVKLHKYDYETLRNSDAFKFQEWIIEKYGGRSGQSGTDSGIDGWMPDNTPIQVKRQDNVGRVPIDNFLSSAKRHDSKLFEKNKKEKKPVGYFIAFTFGKGAAEEVARLKNKENTIIQLVRVEDFVPLAAKPLVRVSDRLLSRDEKGIREFEFTATCDSEIGIEFYSWDFSYNEKTFKPDVVRDPVGKVKYKFNPGSHCIAVKVIDNEGLEGFETFHLTLNGTVERTQN